MRSTKKKGPRTPALIRAKRLGSAIHAMYATARTAHLINSKWAESVAVLNGSFDARGAASDAIARAAGFREPPEPEPATQSTPKKPLAPAGGAARPITLTWLAGGAACLEVGHVALSLSSDEASVLRAIWSPNARRGCE
ncbi:hypothetical protein QMO14_17050 [Variovorax sp. CAN2819]|uniref:hypothetical protein n=1 Tax=Variovorax sp. CAN15 TaxID=3046727 RepID=UPI002649309C|nr:hypothetical protein [Variovorax sp. CAN15]MDN6885316.1 hypothetical protein [Variovorax sp. CAN15]